MPPAVGQFRREPEEPLRSRLRDLFLSDRDWLLAHPNEVLRRPYVEGEFWPNGEAELPGVGRVEEVDVHLTSFLGHARGPVRVRTPVGDFTWATADAEDAVAWQLRDATATTPPPLVDDE